MLTIETDHKDGTIVVHHFDAVTKHSVRVCTQPDKLTITLPRDELVMVRRLVDVLDRVIPKEPINAMLWVSDESVDGDSVPHDR